MTIIVRLKSLERIIEQHFKEEEVLCKRLKAILWTVGYAPAQTTRHIRKGSGYILQPYGGLVFIYYEQVFLLRREIRRFTC